MPAPDADQLSRWLDELDRVWWAIRPACSRQHQERLAALRQEIAEAWRDAIEAEARAS